MSKIYDFLKECNVFYLATISEGKPAIRPFGAVMELHNALYISTSNDKDVYKQLKKSPYIQIVALKGETREWIRVNGKATEVLTPELKQDMLNTCPILNKRFDGCNCPFYALFSITEIRATLNSDRGVKAL